MQNLRVYLRIVRLCGLLLSRSKEKVISSRPKVARLTPAQCGAPPHLVPRWRISGRAEDRQKNNDLVTRPPIIISFIKKILL